MQYTKKLTLEYVGTNFAGWQVQDNGRTVQEELQKALLKLYKQKITAAGSGRTDSGVHALGQVASYRADMHLPDRGVVLGLNSMLPDDMAVIKCEDVPSDFHAQYSAVSKTYLYKIHASPVRSAIHADRSWWVKCRLDVQRMGALLKLFEGEHDFTSFCVLVSLRKNNVRTINSTACYEKDGLICIEINGNGFLHNMVRIIVGTLVRAVKKELDDSYITNALNAANRKAAGPTAVPAGLYLKEVFY
jgi:tRNA pseudouridine38-40 synthase